MIILPAVFLGGIVAAAVVFYLGYVITSAILNWVAGRRKAGGSSAGQLPVILAEDSIEKLSLVGGVLAIGLAVLLLFAIQEELTLVVWIVLTILGLLAGFLSFLLAGTRASPPAAANRAGDPGGAPPAHGGASQAQGRSRGGHDGPTIIIPCPNCAQKLRIPRPGRKLIITCPKCGHSFPYGPDRIPLAQALQRSIRSLWKKLRS